MVDQICAGLIVDPTPDATTYDGKTFIAGPLPIKHENQDGFTYHELAHKLAIFLKYQSSCDKVATTKVSNCLSGLHPELATDEKLKYDEEDWADLLSARVNETTHAACVYSTRTKKEEYKSYSLRNSNAADSHSSPLFRLLHIQYLRSGKIPQQCVAALSARGERTQFTNCLAK
ncbi:hypothetical protein EON62_00395 [archaeon]|nr:MAG: hypothetical protein EON62_00395 [archaeon]